MNEPIYEQMQQLIQKLRQADIAYYKHDAPIMSGLEYDRLIDDLVALEEDSGVILSNSPTQHVAGETLETLAEVRHTKPMLSAAKTKSVDDLIRFAAGQDVLLSWKMDGLTLVLRYENGHLSQAITRGRDGIIGEDVTHTVKNFLNVPLTIPILESFEVRGEGVISWENFNAISAELDDAYSHPRNLAAGSVRKLDASEAKKRRLEFWAFDLVSDSLESGSKRAQQQLLARCGFSVVPYLYLPSSSTAHDLELAISSMQPAKFEYPVDGLIMEYDDLAYGKSLGATGHHENRLIALKWADELYETTFRSVELATTRTGMVSLTARFDPVSMDGATVSRAYLHNLDNFRALQLGSGDTIRVYRANMIIPQIAENLTRSGVKDIPTVCPVCGGTTKISMENETKTLFCTNPECQAKHVKAFSLFVSRDAMNIEGLSEATLEKFILHGYVKDFTDLFHLDRYEEEIKSMDGFGEKSYQKLLRNIENARKTTLARLIYSLGIPNIGSANAKVICKAFGDDPKRAEEATEEELVEIQGIGGIMAKTYVEYFADPKHREIYRRLLDEVELQKEVVTEDSQKFSGINFVITGSVEHFANRAEVKAEIEKRGGKVTGSVTSKTGYLINNDVNSTSSKNKKARELGVPIISEETLIGMLEQ